MEFKTQFKRIGDDSFVVLINGKENSIFRIKNWMNGIKNHPSPGVGHMNRFQLTQKEYHGYWTD